MTLIFLEESKDNIAKLGENILILEKEPNNIEVINDLFRYAHTLKGMYATMGFDSFADLTHRMEDLMDLFRAKKIEVTTDRIDMLLKCVNVLEEMIDEYEVKGKVDINIDDYIKILSDSMNYNCNIEENKIIDIDDYMEIKFEIQNIELKGVRLLMFFNSLEKHLEIKKSAPSKEDILNSETDEELGNELIIQTEEVLTLPEIQIIIDEALNVSDKNLIKSFECRTIEYKKENKKSIDVEKELILNNKKDDKQEKNVVDKEEKNVDKNKSLNQIVRIDSQKIDNLMNLVAEMVTDKNRLELRGRQLNDDTLNQAIERLDRNINYIQDIIMKLRMVEMENTFRIFPREIRSISKKLGKEVNLEIKGGDTELDRAVVDQIKNPLVHIIKNSLDHGIEMPEERIKKGKTKEGNLKISARYEGNQVVVEVSDDGKGINPDKIAKKAVEKKLITEDKIVSLTPDEKVNLICLPGFSTAESVTELSGRGVGLDAVNSFIKALNGSMEITSQEDVGTTIKLYVPLTLAIIQAMIIEVNNETFAIPLHSIENILATKDIEFKKAHNSEVIIYKKRTIPAIHLEDIVQSENKTRNEEFAILIKKGKKTYGLLVDKICEQQDIVIKNLGQKLSKVKEFSGATILGDGSIALILDTTNIVE